jgi:two-component system, NarL family, response regulator DevR
MLTSVSDDEAMFNAIMAGAAGYLLKDVRGSELVAGVRRVARGESLLDPALTTRVLGGLWAPHRDDDELAVLTDQERKVLDLIGQGLTNREIGDRLFIAEKTVKNHASNLYAKLGMRHRSEAAAYVAGRAERRRQREA